MITTGIDADNGAGVDLLPSDIRLSGAEQELSAVPGREFLLKETLMEAIDIGSSYDQVMATDRAVNKRIIEPLERDLDALEEILSWEYTTPPDDASYEQWSQMKIQVYWHTYPQMEPLVKSRKKFKK